MNTHLMATIATVAGAIGEARDQSTLHDALQAACLALGFDVFLLTCHHAASKDWVLNTALNNVGTKFLHDYELQHRDRGNVIAERIFAHDAPWQWNCRRDRHIDVRHQAYFDFLSQHDLRAGVTIPLRHHSGVVSVLGLASHSERPWSDDIGHAGTVVASVATTKTQLLGLSSLLFDDEASCLQALSAVQMEILHCIAEGKSNANIALIMSMKEHTVRRHVADIQRKLGVATLARAASVGAPGAAA